MTEPTLRAKLEQLRAKWDNYRLRYPDSWSQERARIDEFVADLAALDAAEQRGAAREKGVMAKKDWTVGNDGRANTSDEFESAVQDVANVIRNTRIGDDPEAQARLIVARLAHVHWLRREPMTEPTL